MKDLLLLNNLSWWRFNPYKGIEGLLSPSSFYFSCSGHFYIYISKFFCLYIPSLRWLYILLHLRVDHVALLSLISIAHICFGYKVLRLRFKIHAFSTFIFWIPFFFSFFFSFFFFKLRLARSWVWQLTDTHFRTSNLPSRINYFT